MSTPQSPASPGDSPTPQHRRASISGSESSVGQHLVTPNLRRASVCSTSYPDVLDSPSHHSSFPSHVQDYLALHSRVLKRPFIKEIKAGDEPCKTPVFARIPDAKQIAIEEAARRNHSSWGEPAAIYHHHPPGPFHNRSYNGQETVDMEDPAARGSQPQTMMPSPFASRGCLEFGLPIFSAIIVIDLATVKFNPEHVAWGFQGGQRFWSSLTQHIYSMEETYNGMLGVPFHFQLRLVGKRDYRFYDAHDFRFGMVKDFMSGLEAAAEAYHPGDLELPNLRAMERNLIELARPAHRVYLAQASTLPLPRFAHHLSTVSLVVGGDHVLSGRAVLGVEPWLSLLDLKTHKPRTSVSELSDPSMFQPDGKILSQQMPSNVRRDMPIRVIRDWHDISLLRYAGPSTPCTSFYLRGECKREQAGKCKYLHGEIAMDPRFLAKYRHYIASQPCKVAWRCKNQNCLYSHADRKGRPNNHGRGGRDQPQPHMDEAEQVVGPVSSAPPASQTS